MKNTKKKKKVTRCPESHGLRQGVLDALPFFLRGNDGNNSYLG
jgi:hypothetical protein